MVDNKTTRRGFLAGAAAVAGAGCLGGGEQDTDGDGVPDQYDYAPKDPEVQSKSDISGSSRTEQPETDEYDESTPEDTELKNTEEPDETTPTEYTPDAGEPVSMEYLEENSPGIAKAVKRYNNTEYEAVTGVANWVVEEYLDYNEAILQPSSSMDVYLDSDAEEASDRYIAQLNFETNLASNYADITDHMDGGELTGEAHKLFTYLFEGMFNESLEENSSLTGVTRMNRQDDQDAINAMRYTVDGAEGGRVEAFLEGRYFESVADWASKSTSRNRGPLRKLASRKIKAHS